MIKHALLVLALAASAASAHAGGYVRVAAIAQAEQEVDLGGNVTAKTDTQGHSIDAVLDLHKNTFFQIENYFLRGERIRDESGQTLGFLDLELFRAGFGLVVPNTNFYAGLYYERYRQQLGFELTDYTEGIGLRVGTRQPIGGPVFFLAEAGIARTNDGDAWDVLAGLEIAISRHVAAFADYRMAEFSVEGRDLVLDGVDLTLELPRVGLKLTF